MMETAADASAKERLKTVLTKHFFGSTVGWLKLALAVAVASGLGARLTVAQPSPVVVGPQPPMAGVDAGELLLGELNCVACHQADAPVRERLASRVGPVFHPQTGAQMTPQYLRAFLNNPHGEKPGTTMPDLLHDFPAAQKAETVEALVHFLMSVSPVNTNAPLGADLFKMQLGRSLYHQLGCVACHAPQEPAAALQNKAGLGAEKSAELAAWEKTSVPLGNLAQKTTVAGLAKFLMSPLKARPSGRMPSLDLGLNEATAIAMYLLREQAQSSAPNQKPEKTQGLSYQYYEGNFNDTTSLDTQKVKATGTVDHFTLSKRQREDNIAFRFTGFMTIPADGRYTFYAQSDDGTRLFIDDKLVVENDGVHAASEKKGAMDLKQGDHPIQVRYFNGAGESVLKVSWEGPGLAKQTIPASALWTMEGHAMKPLGEEPFTLNAEKVARGKEFFAALGCASCHAAGGTPVIASTLDAKPFAALVPAAGCLADKAGKGVPQYALSSAQREALRATVAARGKLTQPLDAAEKVKHTMAALNCYACHSRDGVGGPQGARAEYFTVVGEADLGDEGRMPPHLTRVGDKLRPSWVREVLENKGAARPYMATRMPQFGPKNVGHLAESFEQADSAKKAESAPSAADAKFGRVMVGTGGFSCISCHTFAGQKSLGIPAMDLTLMAKRLKGDWFHRYLLDPPALRPGTRMPSFWPEGKSARKDILGGNTDRQVDAIWAYLANAKDGGLPPGLIQGKLELVVTNEAVIYRNFIAGGGARAIGVGYPEKANLAFDANELRLALIWQGPFIDLAKHRNGRGAGYEGPLGYNILKMPAGAPFAILQSPTDKWPADVGRKAGYQMRGYQLDEQRRPAFRYAFGKIQIEDVPVAVSGEVEASFRRTFTLHAAPAEDKLWFCAWSGPSVTAQADGSYLADGKVKLKFEQSGNAKPVIRQSGGNTELLVPITFQGAEAKIVEEIQW